jgi:hypothetical protein
MPCASITEIKAAILAARDINVTISGKRITSGYRKVAIARLIEEGHLTAARSFQYDNALFAVTSLTFAA